MTDPSTNPLSAELLTSQEAADYLRVSLQAIYDWVNDGTIPVERAGRSLRFRKADLDAWLKRHQTQPDQTSSAA